MSDLIPFTVYLDRHSILNLLHKHTSKIKDIMEKYGLSKREQEVCLLILKGFEVKTIAEKLYISRDTVHSHIKSIYQKCNVKNKIQLSNLINNIRYES